jgi:hypothetical protein
MSDSKKVSSKISNLDSGKDWISSQRLDLSKPAT